MISFDNANPIPVRSTPLATAVDARLYRSVMVVSSDAGIPQPESETAISAWVGVYRNTTLISPLAVYFSALLSRFVTTVSSKGVSA